MLPKPRPRIARRAVAGTSITLPAAQPAVTEQRETTTDGAGPILMGVRYYNWTTGAFTSPDSVVGGNDTTFGYPTDHIVLRDITGLRLTDERYGGYSGSCNLGLPQQRMDHWNSILGREISWVATGILANV